MRTKWKRTLLTAVAGSLVVSLAACSEEGADAGGGVNLDGKKTASMADYKTGAQFKATEPLDVSLLYLDQSHYPIKDDWLLWKEITQRTNVTIKPTVVPYSDYDQKRGLLISSGDAPTIISKTYPGQEEQFVSSGAILPVSDYIDLMPHFKDKVEKWKLQPELNTLRQEDGKFYVLPGMHEKIWQDYTLAFRTDELKRLNLQTPKNWDEVYTVLKAIKAANPDSYPLSDRFEAKSILNYAGQTFGTQAGWGYVKNTIWNESAQKYEFTGATPEYKQLIEYFHKLVSEGLMDPESFTQKDDAAIQKFASGKSFAISSNAQNIINDYRPNVSKIPGATVAKIPLPAGPKGDVIRGTRLESGLMVSAKAVESDKFVATMQFIDWLWYSDEAQEFTKWGVKGTTYDKDASGKRALKPEVAFGGMNVGAPKNLQRDFGFQGGVFYYGGANELLQSMFTEEEIAFQKTMADKKVVPLPPPAPLNEEERERAALMESPLKDLVTQSTLQFILGQRDLSTWDAYVKELEAKGSNDLVELVNGAHKRYKEKNG
ncbi:sugar ABC transporter substrate-binding protein [Saccharothrix sp. NRRL B-16348]|uniref:ABC transporter substrate-binding protein n=1 Tax=Saccharothrix sp. NRRL B-16348 TaxID=1415542 RepID=UPI0006B05207|nr:extracellular solute-binding protein [Saccharothrix sp. NRRL B-16348]KOX14451.1 sugar ABC transporter substrate-binding protein [Saccharothrix sp. NRRL B-16348]